MRFVLDNSVTMRWLFGDGSEADLAYATRILQLLESEETEALVPCLWHLEVGNVIVRAEAKGLIPEARSAEFLGLLNDMAIVTDDETVVHARGGTLRLARRFGLSTYDAAYLELALRNGLPLATLDADLRTAVSRTGETLA
jgi:predicted nucleic acid-binding protein